MNDYDAALTQAWQSFRRRYPLADISFYTFAVVFKAGWDAVFKAGWDARG